MNAASHTQLVNEPPLVPVAEAFRMLSIGRTTGYALIKERRLRLVKIGGKSLIPRHSIQAFLSEIGA